MSFFGPDEVVYGYASEEMVFGSENGTTCKVVLSGTRSTVTIDATCDEDEPVACTGRITHIVTRTTYRFDRRALDDQMKTT